MIITRAATHLQLKYCLTATNLYLKYYRTGIHRSPTPEMTSLAATHPQPAKYIRISDIRKSAIGPSLIIFYLSYYY